MPKKLPPEKLEQMIKPLPTKDRIAIREQQPITEQWLEDKIKRCKGLMKRDLWMGLPLMFAYLASMLMAYFSNQNIANNITVSLGVLAFGYFGYTVFTIGSYGTNRKRLGVYQALLNEIK